MTDTLNTSKYRSPKTGGLVILILSIGLVFTACREKHIVRGYPDQYSGIGVELKIDPITTQPLVERVLPGSPSEQAGVMVGDKIVAIDEQPTKGLPFGEIIIKIRGKPGSQLSLKLDRAGRTIWSVMPRGSLKRVDEDYQIAE